MRIGSRGTTTLSIQPTQDQAMPAAFGAGVGEALQGLASAFGQRGVTLAQLQSEEGGRQRNVALTRAQIDMERMRGEVDRERSERRTNVAPGALGYTDQTAQTMQARWQTYRQGLEQNYPQLRTEDFDRLELQWTGVAEGAITSDYNFEIEESVRSSVADIEELTQAAMVRVRENPASAMGEYTALSSILGSANLPMLALEEVDTQIRQQLFTVAFEQEALAASRDQLPVRDPDQAAAAGDVVAPGLTGAERGLLGTISSVESNYGSDAYRVLFGGQTFSNFTDHPRTNVPIPNDPRGRSSSAAGRYQFLASTWDFVRESMEREGYDFGPEAFSPVNQDRAAVWYARHRYNEAARQRGFAPELADFDTVLNSGDPAGLAVMRQVFAGSGDNTVWQGLQHLTNEQFSQRLAVGAAPGATGSSSMPDIWNDPRFASIPYDNRARLEAAASAARLAQQRAAADAALAAQQQAFSQLRLSYEAGAPDLLAQTMAVLPQISDPDIRRQVLALSATERKAQADSAMVGEAVSRGVPLSAGNAEAVDSYFRTSGIAAGMAAHDEEAGARAVQAFQRTGQLGPETLASLVSMMQHSSPESRTYALSTLSELYSAAPQAFLGLSNEDARDAGVLWSEISRISTSPQQALDRYDFAERPENQAALRVRREELDTIFESRTPESVFNSVTGMFSGAQMPQGADLSFFGADYRRAFEDAFLRTGNESIAHNVAVTTLQTVYQPDPLSGRLTYLGPTSPAALSTAPNLGGTEWITESLYEQYPELAGATDVSFVTTRATREAIQAGQPPSYLIEVTDADGMIRIALDENNQPLQFRLEPTDQAVTRAALRAQRTFLEERRERLREETLTSFPTAAFGVNNRTPGGPAAPSTVDPRQRERETVEQQLQELRAAEVALTNAAQPDGEFTMLDAVQALLLRTGSGNVGMMLQYLRGQ